MSHAQHDDSYDADAYDGEPYDREAYDRRAARRRLRRGKAAVGAVGLAALLGGGAFAITNLLTDQPPTTATDSGALSPLDRPSPAPSSPAASALPARHGRSGSVAARTTSPAPSASKSKSAAQRVKDARADAAKHGVKLTRPLPTTTAPQGDVTVTNSGSLADRNGTLRVVSARADLTGRRELAWVAGDGVKYGDARCTQTLRFANNTKPSKKPTLMLCWRTSATKSVAVVLVNVKKKPSMADAVAALDRRWRQMG